MAEAAKSGVVTWGGESPRFWVKLAPPEKDTEHEKYITEDSRYQPLLDIIEKGKNLNIDEPEMAWIGLQLRTMLPRWREQLKCTRLMDYIIEAENANLIEIRHEGLQHYVQLKKKN